MSSAPPTVTLRRDWDYQPRLGSSKGHHASRHREQEAIVDFVERRDEGSMLVVGRRGSGKTSLVIASVNKAMRGMPRDKTIIPVPVKATSIEHDGRIDKKQMLVSLIRSLQREVHADRGARSLRRRVDRLYEDATATEKFKVRSSTKTLIGSLNLGMLPSYALVVSMLAFGSDWLGEYGWAPVILALAPAIALAGRWGVREQLITSSRHDYDFADIQREFEQLLQGCSATHKIVFVLDEFDKIGGGQTVAGIMAPVKMLINQGGALYILITSPDKTEDIEERPGENYTVFSETLFVKRSLFGEMERFIDGIAEERSAGLTDAQYDDLRSYLCYRAEADFFDLHRVICDQKTGTDEHGRPVLRALLDDKEKTAANLQRAIKYVYDRKAFGSLSKQRLNDDMLETMYGLATRSEGMINQAITISGRNVTIEGRTYEYDEHKASAARDLFILLRDEGYLANGGDAFTVRGTLSRFKGGTHVEEERAFDGAYKRLLGAMVDIANCKRHIDRHAARFEMGTAEDQLDDLHAVVAPLAPVSIPDEMREYKHRIGAPGGPSVPPDALRQYTDQALHAVRATRTSSVDLLAEALRTFAGIQAAVSDEVPPDLASTAALRGRSVHNAASAKPGAGTEIRLAVIDAQDAEVSESVRLGMTGTDSPANEVVILLAGDDTPAGIDQSFFVVDSVDSVGRLTNAAMIRARDFGAYGFVLKSPLTVRQLGLALVSIDKVKAHRLTGNMANFELEWDSLKALASGQARVTDAYFDNRRMDFDPSSMQEGAS